MIGLVERVLALNPSFAGGWFRSGLLRLFAGQPDVSIEHIETSLRLSPYERIGVPLFVMGTGYFFKGAQCHTNPNAKPVSMMETITTPIRCL